MTNTQEQPNLLKRAAIGVAEKYLERVGSDEDDQPGWLSRFLTTNVVEPVVLSEEIQVQVADILDTEITKGVVQIKNNVPVAFDLAKQNTKESPNGNLYGHIREKMRTSNETITQKFTRPLFARILATGSRILGFLTVNFANNISSKEFTADNKDSYNGTMSDWFAYWFGKTFGKSDEATSPWVKIAAKKLFARRPEPVTA